VEFTVPPDRIANIVEQANVGIAEVDLTGRFVFVNPRYCELTGRTREELLQLRMQDITHPADLGPNLALLERCVREGRHFAIEKRYVRPDGSHVWVENSVSLVTAADGTPEFVLAFSVDISSRKIAELRLLESEERSRLISRAINDVIWDWDRRSNFVVWNESLLSVFGYAPADATGPIDAALDWWSSRIHEDEREAVLSSFLAAARGTDETWAKEYRFLAADGAYRHVIDRGYIGRNDAGEPLRMVGSMQDVTAIRQAQEGLRLAQEYGGVGVWTWDIPSQQVHVEPQLERLYGVPPGTIRTYADWARLFSDEQRSAIEGIRDEALAARRPFELELPVHRDGSERWLLARGRGEYDETGRVLRVLGVIVDITDRKRSELALRESEARLREADRQKDAFLAMLAHELRNPLAPMRTAVSILKTQAPDEATLTRCQNVLDRQVAQMARLLDDLLDVSRLSRGTLDLQLKPVLLRDVVEAAVETSRPVIDQHGHDLTIEGLEEPILLDADPARLVQVFGNILNNAAHYSDSGGRIHIAVSRAGDEVRVAIRDTGRGIDAEFLPRVFEPFTQADVVQARSAGGLGIGLWLARRIVDMHGGTITASSEGPGRGSEFVVRLIARTAAPPAPDPAGRTPDVQASAAGRRVLVADDNVDSADMIAALLESVGCEVRAVYDGDEAVEEAERFRPQLLLLDIGMPTLNGYDACRRIRSQPWAREATVIALTGWGQQEDRRRSLEAGFDKHLVKPVDPEELLALVGAV